MTSIVDALLPHERRAVALVGLMIRMHGGKDGEGAFAGLGRYAVLTAGLRLCAEQSRSVREMWDRSARRMRWNIGPQRYDDAALALMPVGWVIERLSDTAMGPPGHLTADGCKVEIVNDAHTGPCVASGNACTRPAALCAAILRAHADTVSNSGERPW